MTPDERINAIAFGLRSLIGALNDAVTEAIESPAHSIFLVVACDGHAQYASNVPREEGVRVLSGLFTRWNLEMPEVLPETSHGADVTLFATLLDTFSDLVRTHEKGSPELDAPRRELLAHVGRLQALANRIQ